MRPSDDLYRLKNIQKLIDEQTMTYEELSINHQRLTAKINDMPSGGTKSDLSDVIARMETEMDNLLDLINEQFHKRELVIDRINRMPNSLQASVLHAYFVNNLTLEYIASVKNLSYKGVWAIKEEAVKEFDRIYNNFTQ